MNKRDVVIAALNGEEVPYTPWQMGFTFESLQKLEAHYGDNINKVLGNHLVGSSVYPAQKDIGNNRHKDFFGVVWDRTEDKDIGIVEGCLLPEANLDNYTFPSMDGIKKFHTTEIKKIQTSEAKEHYRFASLGFSLFERAWTLRGMENLLMDFILNPEFAHELLRSIADLNIAAVGNMINEDIDAVMFGDDWGQQHGLIMGPDLWRKFIMPELKRTYGFVKDHGKRVIIHSCGDVQELFDDLIDLGLDCFNPFQPEVMDVHALHSKYKGKLSFWGGLSTQKTLPYGSVKDVRAEVDSLLKMGLKGNYIFAPAHAVEGDVPLENLLTFIKMVNEQAGIKSD